jgi:hypothetical protein
MFNPESILEVYCLFMYAYKMCGCIKNYEIHFTLFGLIYK